MYISEAIAVHGSFGFHSRADHFASCPNCNGTYEKELRLSYWGYVLGVFGFGVAVVGCFLKDNH